MSLLSPLLRVAAVAIIVLTMTLSPLCEVANAEHFTCGDDSLRPASTQSGTGERRRGWWWPTPSRTVAGDSEIWGNRGVVFRQDRTGTTPLKADTPETHTPRAILGGILGRTYLRDVYTGASPFQHQALEDEAAKFGLEPGLLLRVLDAWADEVAEPYDCGLAALYQGDSGRALTEFTEAAGKPGITKAELVCATSAIGFCAFQLEKYQEAAKAYRLLLELDPYNAIVASNLACSLLEVEQVEEVLSLLEYAHQINELNEPGAIANAANFANDQAVYFFDIGDYNRARSLFELALARLDDIGGETHPSYTRVLRNLAVTSQLIGEYGIAESYVSRAIILDRDLPRGAQLDYAADLDILADIHSDRYEYTAAVPLARQAVNVVKEALGDRHPLYACYLGGLAGLPGVGPESVDMYEEAIEITRAALGETAPRLADLMSGLAWHYGDLKRYDDAQRLFESALEIHEANFGTAHWRCARDFDGLAMLHFKRDVTLFGYFKETGDSNPAVALAEKAVEIASQTQGPTHVDHLLYLSHLGHIYVANEEFDRAGEIFRRALELSRPIPGGRSRAFHRALHDLARFSAITREYDAAEDLHRQSVEAITDLAGKWNSRYIDYLRDFGIFFSNRNRLTEAELCFSQCLEISAQVYGTGYVEYANSAADYRRILLQLKKYEAAEALSRELLDLSRDNHGEDSLEYISNLMDLAQDYHRKTDLLHAEARYLDVLQRAKRVLGTNHPQYGGFLSILARLYEEDNNVDAAIYRSTELMEIEKEKVGPNHKDYAWRLIDLSELYKKKGDISTAKALVEQAIDIFEVQLPPDDADLRLARRLHESLIEPGSTSQRAAGATSP